MIFSGRTCAIVALRVLYPKISVRPERKEIMACIHCQDKENEAARLRKEYARADQMANMLHEQLENILSNHSRCALADRDEEWETFLREHLNRHKVDELMLIRKVARS